MSRPMESSAMKYLWAIACLLMLALVALWMFPETPPREDAPTKAAAPPERYGERQVAVVSSFQARVPELLSSAMTEETKRMSGLKGPPPDAAGTVAGDVVFDLSVQVTDMADGVVAGADIYIAGQTGSNSIGQTDRNGSYFVSAIDGFVSLYASKPGVGVSEARSVREHVQQNHQVAGRPESGFDLLEFEKVMSREPSIQLKLTPSGSLSGTVWKNGTPLADAMVFIEDAALKKSVWSRGKSRINMSVDGLKSGSTGDFGCEIGSPFDGYVFATFGELVSLRHFVSLSSTDNKHVDIRFPNGRTHVHGWTEDELGNRLPGVSIDLMCEGEGDSTPGTTISDERGEYDIALESEAYSVIATCRGFIQPKPEKIAVSDARPEWFHVIRMRRCKSLLGVARYSDGAPAKLLTLTATPSNVKPFPATGSQDWSEFNEDIHFITNTYTLSDGAFEFKRIDPERDYFISCGDSRAGPFSAADSPLVFIVDR